uniref:Uncharacterized protein n=1 Tax=Rhizophora mucronata TaxID=61149 RepID=A0A2P2IJI3_RHIMU
MELQIAFPSDLKSDVDGVLRDYFLFILFI